MLGGFLSRFFGKGDAGQASNSAPDLRQAEIGQQVLALFEREREDGVRRLGDSYWGAGAANVGHAVIKAVTVSVAALLERADAPITVSDAQAVLEATRERYRDDPDDEDGYGIGTFNALVNGMDAIVQAEGKKATFSTRVLATFAPQDSTDPTAWTDIIYTKLSEASEVFRAVLDQYAAGDFAGVARTISELDDDQWPPGFTRSITLLNVNCMIRSVGERAAEPVKALLESGKSEDDILNQLMGLLLGTLSMDKFEVLNDDNPVMMCTGYYLIASHHLIREEYSQATAMLDKCLSMRIPAMESYLAWADLIALDPTRGQAPA
jgi:hypothetical protein